MYTFIKLFLANRRIVKSIIEAAMCTNTFMKSSTTPFLNRIRVERVEQFGFARRPEWHERSQLAMSSSLQPRADRKSQVRQYLGFFSAKNDKKSAVQKPK